MRTSSGNRKQVSDFNRVDIHVLERLFDHVQEIAFFIKDREGRYLAVNQSLATRHGLKSKSQALGKRPTDICPGEFGCLPAEQDAEVLSTGRSIIDHLEMQWHLPHQPVWCLTTKLPLLDDCDQVIGVIGFSRDVRVSLDLSELPEDFAKTLEDFERRLHAHATPSWLAQASKLSLQRFARLMKRVFDLTPSQYITKTRVAAASRRLLETDDSVSEIAQACGFYDHSAFSRAFRMATGTTPTEFRARWQIDRPSSSE